MAELIFKIVLGGIGISWLVSIFIGVIIFSCIKVEDGYTENKYFKTINRIEVNKDFRLFLTVDTGIILAPIYNIWYVSTYIYYLYTHGIYKEYMDGVLLSLPIITTFTCLFFI